MNQWPYELPTPLIAMNFNEAKKKKKNYSGIFAPHDFPQIFSITFKSFNKKFITQLKMLMGTAGKL